MTYHVVSKTATTGPYNKRRGINPVPYNIGEFLNHQQLVSLRQMEYFGWRLSFIRRMGTDAPMTFVSNGSRFAKLEVDGSLNCESDVNIRD